MAKESGTNRTHASSLQWRSGWSTANSDKEKGEKRAVVKAKFGLDDLAVNALDGAALDGLFAQCQTSTGLNGAFRQVNNNDSFSEMPE